MSTVRTGPADWNAAEYARVSSPQQLWAKAVLDRLELGGNETVLDAGCGSGEVTALLAGLLPEGRIIAVDGSPSMVEAAAVRLPGDRVEFRCLDLTDLGMEGEVDHAFSNAVFHWIDDHESLLSGLHYAIRPGGQLVAQCGGMGNVAEVVAALGTVCLEQPFADSVAGCASPWNFAGPEESEVRLRRAGFAQAECWLENQTARPEEPQAFLEAACLAPVRESLAPELFPMFSDRMMEVMDQPETFQYVRLNIVASRD
jgi:trans-aconitate 2-methyltransferase